MKKMKKRAAVLLLVVAPFFTQAQEEPAGPDFFTSVGHMIVLPDSGGVYPYLQSMIGVQWPGVSVGVMTEIGLEGVAMWTQMSTSFRSQRDFAPQLTLRGGPVKVLGDGPFFSFQAMPGIRYQASPRVVMRLGFVLERSQGGNGGGLAIQTTYRW